MGSVHLPSLVGMWVQVGWEGLVGPLAVGKAYKPSTSYGFVYLFLGIRQHPLNCLFLLFLLSLSHLGPTKTALAPHHMQST